MSAAMELIDRKAHIRHEIGFIVRRLNVLQGSKLKNKGFHKLITEYYAKLADLREIEKVLNL